MLNGDTGGLGNNDVDTLHARSIWIVIFTLVIIIKIWMALFIALPLECLALVGRRMQMGHDPNLAAAL